MGSGCPKTGTIPPLHFFVATIPLLLILFLNWRSQEEAKERKLQFHILCPRSPGDAHQFGVSLRPGLEYKKCFCLLLLCVCSYSSVL